MRITNLSVLILIAIFAVAGLFLLPLEVYAMRWVWAFGGFGCWVFDVHNRPDCHWGGGCKICGRFVPVHRQRGWAAIFGSFCRRFVGVVVGASYRGQNHLDPQGYRNMGQSGGWQIVSYGRGLSGYIDP